MACYRCKKIQTDPAKGRSPWARMVLMGQQVLICPECQLADPGWQSLGQRCPACQSSRLAVVLDRVVCRQCGKDYER